MIDLDIIIYYSCLDNLFAVIGIYVLFISGKGLPEIKSILTDFKNAFDWVEANNTGRIIPHVGGDMDYDSACKKCKEIECSLAKYLKEQRKLLGDTSVRI